MKDADYCSVFEVRLWGKRYANRVILLSWLYN